MRDTLNQGISQWGVIFHSFRLMVYPASLLVYYLLVASAILNGYVKELLGHKGGHGHHHDHLHRIAWQWHTGLHIDPRKSYGDERRLKRTAASSTRATPEGAQIYWSRHKRPIRALHNNAISVGFITLLYGLVFWSALTIQIITVLLILGLFALGALTVRKVRTARAAQPSRKVSVKELAKVGAADSNTLHVTGAGDVREERPQLDGGVPQKVMALLLSDSIACSSDETFSRLTMTPDMGEMLLPDHFPALPKQRETVEQIVQAQTSSKVAFTWHTDKTPRKVTWVPIVTSLPKEVLFRDHLPQLERLWPGEFGVGINVARKLYVVSHNGDTPNHLRSCGPGTGKSTAFQIKLAQICKRDPLADVYCIDTKQVSFENSHGIPGVYIFDDPVDRMGDIYDSFYKVHQIMRDRYTAIRTKRAKLADFNDIWLLVDEGNDLAGQMKLWYDKHVRQRNDPTQPKVWTEAIAPIINMGRQVKIRGEWMFQNMTDKVLGGVSLRDAWSYIGMAGYAKNQWGRIIGTTPVPELRTGPGRIMMVNGPDQQWIQGFYDDPDWLREYAMSARRERAA